MKKNPLNFSLIVFLLVSSLFASGVLVGKKANAQKERQGRTKEQVCLDMLAKVDEKAQNRDEYINRLNEAIDKLLNLDLPEGYEEYEAKRQEALAKANELKAALEALLAEYDKVRPTIDCSDPEEALRKVQQVKEEVTGRGSVVSQYAPDLDFKEVRDESKNAKDIVKDTKSNVSDIRKSAESPFGALLGK